MALCERAPAFPGVMRALAEADAARPADELPPDLFDEDLEDEVPPQHLDDLGLTMEPR